MARLPQPGADGGTWGTILNDFLSQSLAGDGTLKASSVGASQLQNNVITTNAIADGAVTAAKVAADVATQSELDTVAAGGVTTIDGGTPSARQTNILPRHGTAAQWTTANPVLAAGEIGQETDTGVVKLGDGTTAWVALKPIQSQTGLAARVSQAEIAVANGTVPARMSSPPTTILTKGSGITGTPTVSAGGSGYTVGDQITLAGGTALSAAILQVSTVSLGAITAVSVIRNGIYTATPSNPVSQATTTGSGSGATFTVAWSTGGMSTALSRVSVGATDSRYRFTGNGPGNQGGSGYYGNASGNGTHSSFEWATDSQRVDIRLIGLNTSGILYVDGKQLSSTTVTTDASGSAYAYSLEFSSSVMRHFKWLAFNNGFGGVYIDSTATLTAPLFQTPPFGWSIGDSYSLSTGAENSGTTHIMAMADQLGIDILPDGIGGAGWNSGGATAPATRITAKLATLTRTPAYVFLDMGYNDAGGNMTTLATAFDTAVTAIRSAAPNAKIFAFGPATPIGRTTNLDAVRDAISVRCAANGVTFIDVGDWVNSSNRTIYTGVDNAHPTSRGHKYLGARRAEVIRPLL